jgi:hypothetical protein
MHESPFGREDIMECENSMNTGELLFEMILASMALGPRMSTEERIPDYNQEMLRSSGIFVNDLRTILLDCSRIGGRIIRIGRFIIDLETKVGEKARSVRDEGLIKGIIQSDGTVSIEYVGNKFRRKLEFVSYESIDAGMRMPIQAVPLEAASPQPHQAS